MNDMRAHLEKLRVQIAECELIRDLTTDRAKRDLFARLVEQLKLSAIQVERGLDTAASDAFLGRQTQEPFPNEEE